MAIKYADIAEVDSHRAENKGRSDFETGFAPASPILMEGPILQTNRTCERGAKELRRCVDRLTVYSTLH
jgi:hypothetical protein